MVFGLERQWKRDDRAGARERQQEAGRLVRAGAFRKVPEMYFQHEPQLSFNVRSP